MTRHVCQAVKVAKVLMLLAGCWAAWALGGLLIASLGLDDLDLIGRVFLVFAFLTACQAVPERLRRGNGNAHHQQE
jgi:hypothetical protein